MLRSLCSPRPVCSAFLQNVRIVSQQCPTAEYLCSDTVPNRIAPHNRKTCNRRVSLPCSMAKYPTAEYPCTAQPRSIPAVPDPAVLATLNEARVRKKRHESGKRKARVRKKKRHESGKRKARVRKKERHESGKKKARVRKNRRHESGKRPRVRKKTASQEKQKARVRKKARESGKSPRVRMKQGHEPG